MKEISYVCYCQILWPNLSEKFVTLSDGSTQLTNTGLIIRYFNSYTMFSGIHKGE